MKKIILMLTMILGLVSLSSCEEKAQITITNDQGEEETVEIVETDDQEAVKNVIAFANKANYDDTTKITITDSMKLNVTISKELAQALELKDTNRLKATYKDSLKMNLDEGIECRFAAEVKADENNYAKANASIIYNGPFANVASKEALAYVDVYYDYKTTSLSSNYSQKKAINPVEYLTNLGELFPISPDLPPVDTDIDDDFDLSEFSESYPNSKIFIETVTNNKIIIGVDISYKDIVEELDLSVSELLQIQDAIDLNKSFHISIGIDEETGKLVDIGCTFKDASLISFIISNFISVDTSNMKSQLIEAFEFTMTSTIVYDAAKIDPLTEEEKAQYKIETVAE